MTTPCFSNKRLKTRHEGRLDAAKTVEEKANQHSYLIGKNSEIEEADTDLIDLTEDVDVEEVKPSARISEDAMLADLLMPMEEANTFQITLTEQHERAHQTFGQTQRQLIELCRDQATIVDRKLSSFQQLGSTIDIASSSGNEIDPPFASMPLAVHVPAHNQHHSVPPIEPVQKTNGANWKTSGTTKAKKWPFEATLYYNAPESLSRGTDHFLQSSQFPTGDECPICMGDFRLKPTVKVTICNHKYHRECIVEALKHCPKCPTCRADVIEPRGRCPSGTMKVAHSKRRCNGCTDADGSITIQYTLEGGFQKEYHERPGEYYTGTNRTAYVPNNDQGRELLKRLKYAWTHGLSFTVGTSLTTGRANVITWSSIHHKTSPRGGAFGFPDPNYFDNCNEELDALGVPASRDLA